MVRVEQGEHECPRLVAVGVEDQPHHRAELAHGVGGATGDGRQALGVLTDELRVQLLSDGLLRRVVAVQRRLSDTGALGDVPYPGRVVTLLGEAGQRGFQDRLLLAGTRHRVTAMAASIRRVPGSPSAKSAPSRAPGECAPGTGLASTASTARTADSAVNAYPSPVCSPTVTSRPSAVRARANTYVRRPRGSAAGSGVRGRPAARCWIVLLRARMTRAGPAGL